MKDSLRIRIRARQARILKREGGTMQVRISVTSLGNFRSTDHIKDDDLYVSPNLIGIARSITESRRSIPVSIDDGSIVIGNDENAFSETPNSSRAVGRHQRSFNDKYTFDPGSRMLSGYYSKDGTPKNSRQLTFTKHRSSNGAGSLTQSKFALLNISFRP